MSVTNKLKTYLFEKANKKGMHLYAIVDSAVDGIIDGHFESDEPEKYILYREESDLRDLELRAPHLVVLQEEDIFTQRLFTEGYGRNWGCFIFSLYDAQTLAEHLRDYTKVYSYEHRQNVYIRFYDPRAMEKYFRLFDTQEAQRFFSKLSYMMAENPKDTDVLHLYSLHQKTSQVQREEKKLQEVSS